MVGLEDNTFVGINEDTWSNHLVGLGRINFVSSDLVKSEIGLGIFLEITEDKSVGLGRINLFSSDLVKSEIELGIIFFTLGKEGKLFWILEENLEGSEIIFFTLSKVDIDGIIDDNDDDVSLV